MIAQLDAWQPKGRYIVLSPCGRFEIRKGLVAGTHTYWAFPRPNGPALTAACATAAECWDLLAVQESEKAA